MAGVFLSYARSDDEPFVERLHQDLSERGIPVWWDRRAMESRGLTFLQEIRDAIDESDRIVAVVGPHAVRSAYCRAEWQHALLFSRGIVPILRVGDHDLLPAELRTALRETEAYTALLPGPLSTLHCPDFRSERPYAEALDELVRILPPADSRRTPH